MECISTCFLFLNQRAAFSSAASPQSVFLVQQCPPAWHHRILHYCLRPGQPRVASSEVVVSTVAVLSVHLMAVGFSQLHHVLVKNLKSTHITQTRLDIRLINPTDTLNLFSVYPGTVSGSATHSRSVYPVTVTLLQLAINSLVDVVTYSAIVCMRP